MTLNTIKDGRKQGVVFDKKTGLDKIIYLHYKKRMTSRDFTYWLRGYLELSEADSLTKEQTDMIKEHLNLVFQQNEDMDCSNSDDSKDKNTPPMRC